MSNHRFDHFRRHALFITVNVAILGVIYFGAIEPIGAIIADQEQRLARAGMVLDRLRAVVAENARAKSMAIQTSAERPSSAFHAGASIAAVAAELQIRLKRLAMENGAQVKSMRSLDPIDSEGVRFMAVHVEMTGNIQAVHRTFRAIESERPFLFVSRVAMRVPASLTAQQTAQEPILDVQADIQGAIDAGLTQ